MLNDLSTSQRAVADYMSELSEQAYCAGGMEDLEFSLWRIAATGPGRYGPMEITAEHGIEAPRVVALVRWLDCFRRPR